jgi:hypothetical protein
MSKTAENLSCADFQDQLPELVGRGQSLASHPHLQGCSLCHSLLDDLETIAAAARQLFPIEEPPDDLWEHIQSAIENEEAGSYLD